MFVDILNIANDFCQHVIYRESLCSIRCHHPSDAMIAAADRKLEQYR